MLTAQKAAVRVHRTATVSTAWDGPANEARLPSGDGAAARLRAAHAWVDPAADPNTKVAWRFLHHMVAADGSVGAANTIACSTGIGVLNGARGGTTIPAADKDGVQAHLAAHLADAEMEPPPLKAVKFVDGSDDIIEGLAIPFGGPFAGKDLDGEDFGPDTDFALDWFPQGRPLTYHHGVDPAIKTAVQGRQLEHELTDEGVWARAQLDQSAKYHATVARLIAAGKLFFSSGSMPHLIEVDDSGHIKRWPWVELAMTPTPANPLAAFHYAKASDIVDRLAAADLAVPAPLIAEALKALDTTSDPEAWAVPSALEAKAGRVSAAVAELRDHARESLDMRVKAGRVLSAANRERINAALASREAVLAAYADLEALLAETDPEAKSAALAAIDRAVAETLRRAAIATL